MYLHQLNKIRLKIFFLNLFRYRQVTNHILEPVNVMCIISALQGCLGSPWQSGWVRSLVRARSWAVLGVSSLEVWPKHHWCFPCRLLMEADIGTVEHELSAIQDLFSSDHYNLDVHQLGEVSLAGDFSTACERVSTSVIWLDCCKLRVVQ